MVAPLPGQTAVPPPALVALPEAPVPAAAPDPAERTYREALVLVRDRAFARAESALSSLIERHATHARAVDALYWRGVVRYASRSYPRALADFTAVVSRHPRSERAPEALLKMAICHERMGDSRRARSLYERVRSEYPNSVAARVASQEDAS
jgi:tol-pal system protein YbgF